jgi:hypothetical protein
VGIALHGANDEQVLIAPGLAVPVLNATVFAVGHVILLHYAIMPEKPVSCQEPRRLRTGRQKVESKI